MEGLRATNMGEPELSLEECKARAAAVLPDTCIRFLESHDWEEQMCSMDTMQKVVREMKKGEIPCQALLKLLAQGCREKKAQVVKMKLDTIAVLAQKGNFSQATALIVISEVVEMVGDMLCNKSAQEALTAIAEACSLAWTSKTAMILAFSEKNNRVQSKILDWMSRAILEFGFSDVDIKALVDTLKTALVHVQPRVQRSAITLLGVLYLYMGDSLGELIVREKLPLGPQIEAELVKMHGQIPPAPSRASAKSCLGDRTQEYSGDPRRIEAIDISDRITADLLSKLQEKNWKIQKEGLEEVTRILQDVRFIQPNLGELSRALKACLHDENPTLLETALRVLQQLPTAMGSGITQHMKDLGLPLIALFRKSKSTTRAAALAAVNAWAAQLNILEWLNGQNLTEDLGEDMPFQKEELVQWLAEHLPTLCSAPSDLLPCVPHLYSCLQDSNEAVRTTSQAALPFFLMHLGFEKMVKATSDLKTAAKGHVLEMLKNANASLSASAEPFSRQSSVNSRDALPPAAGVPVTSLSSQASSKEAALQTSREQKQDSKQPQPVEKEEKMEDKGGDKPKVQVKSTVKDGSGNKQFSIFIVAPDGKEQRMRDEKDGKVLQWNFTAPSKKHTEQLKAQMSSCVSRSLQVELFQPHFLHQIKALSMMTSQLETEKEGVISCLDLILKWLSLCFFDTNIWVLIKSLKYLNLLLIMLIQEKYQLTENEALSFLPYLVLKMGETGKFVFKLLHAVLKGTCLVYPARKVFGFLMESIKFKNTKQHAGCLGEIGYLLKVYGLEVCEPNPGKALKMIASFLRHQDRAVCDAALNVMVTACRIQGEAVLKMVGDLPEECRQILRQTAEREAGRLRESHQALPPHTEEHKKVMVSRKHNPSKKKFIVRLETIPEHCALLVSSEVGDMGQNIKSTFSFLICCINCRDPDASIQALKEIEEILSHKNKVEAMSGLTNEFLVASFPFFKLSPQQKQNNEKREKDKIILLCSHIIQATMLLFEEKKLAQEVSMEVLKDVISSLLTFRFCFLVREQEEDQELIQSISVLMGRVLRKSDLTNISCALLELLQGSLALGSSSDKFSDCLAICLWRATRLLPGAIETINLDKIMLKVHPVVKSIPREKMSQCTNEAPVRALKTFLNTLCKLKGVRVLDHLALIKDVADSEVEAYLQKTRYLKRALAITRVEQDDRKHLSLPPLSGISSEAKTSPPGEAGIVAAKPVTPSHCQNKQPSTAGFLQSTKQPSSSSHSRAAQHQGPQQHHKQQAGRRVKMAAEKRKEWESGSGGAQVPAVKCQKRACPWAGSSSGLGSSEHAENDCFSKRFRGLMSFPS
ncbi:cytoskeleton-associated protein 5-like [Excalfactoria chinensis]|uniref:cytoskeleton-associated protein 5-like n=1 Tax=Excalfactoria chinensis TaxID=46218 RepID=UPI003B3A8CB4